MPDDIHQFRHVFLKSAYFFYFTLILSFQRPQTRRPGHVPTIDPPSYATADCGSAHEKTCFCRVQRKR